MTVVITSIPAVPSGSGAPAVMDAALATAGQTLSNAPFEWHPERSADGIVSVVISAADQRAIVDARRRRNRVRAGSGRRRDRRHGLRPRSWDNSGKHWLKLKFSGAGGGMEVGAGEAARFDAPAGFRQAVAAAVRPGSVVIVTPELAQGRKPGQSARTSSRKTLAHSSSSS